MKKKIAISALILTIGLISLIYGYHPAIWLVSIPVSLFVHI